jgi:predicted O-linked N-acetylglucosamine transferase (SPINDLY family)
VTESAEDYENLAVRLATEPEALAAIKAKLTRNCPLFDTDLFRRHIEAAYSRMWDIWLAGGRPQAFNI